MDYDAQHLKLLPTFHYVVAGITAAIACFPTIHLAIGVAILTGRSSHKSGDPVAEELMGWMFTVAAGVMIVVMWSLAIVIFCAGRSLQKRRRRLFCLIVAGLECMMMPFGTVLGVFTMVVLMRPSVCRLFEGEGSSAGPADWHSFRQTAGVSRSPYGGL